MSTNCIFPPELEDQQLLAYLDDPNVNQETARHLEHCSYCRQKAETLDRFQKRLKTRLYRSTCPTSMELGEYHLGLLPDARRLVIGQHLRACSYCSQELAQLEAFLVEPALDLSSRIKRIVARLVGGRDMDPGSVLAPATTGLRGKTEELFTYQADKVQIRISIQGETDQPALRRLFGLIVGLETNEFIVEVRQAGQILTSSSVDEIGNFIIGHIPPGTYDLSIRGEEQEIQIQSFTV